MFKAYPNLFIGTERECFFTQKDDWAVVHACKSPCARDKEQLEIWLDDSRIIMKKAKTDVEPT